MSTIRNLAIKLLDDGHGINSEAWGALQELLHISGCDDVIEAVDSIDGRYYLDEGKFKPEDSDDIVFKLLIEDLDSGVDRAIEVKRCDNSVTIGIEGCGLLEMQTGCTEIMYLEVASGEPTLMVWDDINSADPQTILLENALEKNRK
jgi:hypothetical protein